MFGLCVAEVQAKRLRQEEERSVGCLPVQEAKQGAARHELGDNAEVWGQSACAHKQDDIGMLEPLHDRHLRSELLQHIQTPLAPLCHFTYLISQITCIEHACKAHCLQIVYEMGTFLQNFTRKF